MATPLVDAPAAVRALARTGSFRWPLGPENPALHGGEVPPDAVHVWGIALDQPAHAARTLMATLDADERTRAARFHRPVDRDRYIVAHAATRIVLGRYLKRPAHAIRFGQDVDGKPHVADRPGLWFNLSHSAHVGLLAISHAGEVGVDVECIVALPDVLEVANVCFTPNERHALRATPNAERPRAFLAGWTRKEAYLKAVGSGLRAPLQNFEVSLAPGEPSRLCRVNGSDQLASEWTIEALDPAEGCLGALAIRRSRVTVSSWELDLTAAATLD